MEYNVGDYLISSSKELYRIVEKHISPDGVYYDIRGFVEEVMELQDSYGNYHYSTYFDMKSVPADKLQTFGKVVPQSSIHEEAIQILYK